MSKNVLYFSSNNSFDIEVVQASKTSPVLVDFFATWCGPCKKLSPLLEEASEKYGFKLVIIDVEKNKELAAQFEIRSIPLVYLYHKGSKAMEFFGFDKNKLQKMINHIQKIINKYVGKGVSVGGEKEVPKTQNYNQKEIIIYLKSHQKVMILMK